MDGGKKETWRAAEWGAGREGSSGGDVERKAWKEIVAGGGIGDCVKRNEVAAPKLMKEVNESEFWTYASEWSTIPPLPVFSSADRYDIVLVGDTLKGHRRYEPRRGRGATNDIMRDCLWCVPLFLV